MKFRAFWDVAHVVTLKLTDVSEMGIASVIALMMEVVRTSEMSVNINVTTRSYIPVDSKFQKRFNISDFQSSD
jgi:hypothetical protein